MFTILLRASIVLFLVYFRPLAASASNFEGLCHLPEVVRCFGFDFQSLTDPHVYPPYNQLLKRAQVVTDVKASGLGSLRFEIPSNSGADTSGSFFLNFSDDLSAQFGEGQEFYVQWKQRFSPEFLTTPYQGSNSGWKQIIIGEGDRGGFVAGSCTQLEIVLGRRASTNPGLPTMYHSCGGKDGQYQGLEVQDRSNPSIIYLQNAVGCLYNPQGKYNFPPCVAYRPDQWMTFQIHVKVGTWYRNDRQYRRDSVIQLWIAEEAKPSKLVIDLNPERNTGYDIANNSALAKYGKLWLLPYQTGKDASQNHPTAFTWYDDLIISRKKVPDR